MFCNMYIGTVYKYRSNRGGWWSKPSLSIRDSNPILVLELLDGESCDLSHKCLTGGIILFTSTSVMPCHTRYGVYR